MAHDRTPRTPYRAQIPDLPSPEALCDRLNYSRGGGNLALPIRELRHLPGGSAGRGALR